MDAQTKKAQNLYIIQAALEYFVAILVGGSFLATLTSQMGMSDSLTGILSSIISLGCLFQLLSVFYRKRKVKKFVLGMSIINQLLFLFLYIIPLFTGRSRFKIPLFIGMIILSYAIYYFAHPKKTNWLMSLVEDQKRGDFTADKEIVSLITGTVFTFLMSGLLDHFVNAGQIRTGFILSALVMAAVILLHTLVMVMIPEKDQPEEQKARGFSQLSDTLHNRDMQKVTLIFILYNIANYISMPFYGVYFIHELGFSLTFVSVITMIGSVSRILFSKALGRYADRHSFARMLFHCFGFLSLALFFAMLATPETGKVMFVLYYIFHGIAQGGINSSLVNLIFDYVPSEKRADSLAICQAQSGLAGFLATLLASPLIALIQKNQSQVLGMTLYAQQLLSLIAMLVILYAMGYIWKKFLKQAK